LLPAAQRATVVRGVQLYAKALARLRLLGAVTVRPIRRAENAAMREIVLAAFEEFGVVGRPHPEHDRDLGNLGRHYRGRYFVAVGDRVLGGAGYAPLKQGACELRKMYLAPAARGAGLGLQLLRACLDAASKDGYRWCYLNTLGRMDRALRLYRAFGFRRVDWRPAGDTSGCDAWYRAPLGA
jgi:putative acetyltransferase